MLIFTRRVDSLKRVVENFSTTLCEDAVQPSDPCLRLLSNGIYKLRHVILHIYLSRYVCDFQKMSENLAYARGGVKNNE